MTHPADLSMDPRVEAIVTARLAGMGVLSDAADTELVDAVQTYDAALHDLQEARALIDALLDAKFDALSRS